MGVKSAILALFNSLEVLSSTSDKTKLYAEIFSKNCTLNCLDISLSVFPSRIDLNLQSISVAPKLDKKVINNLDSSKVSGPDCILAVVLKNCEPELSYILAELFNMCIEETWFQDCWKASYMVLLFENVIGKIYG